MYLCLTDNIGCSKYKMSSTPRGYAVIVNMSHVLGTEDRKGSEVDVTRLEATWEKLGYEVIIWKDKVAHVMLPQLLNQPVIY